MSESQSAAMLSWQRQQLRRMRAVSRLEAITLVLLIGVAMPIKYIGGYAMATSVMGAVHGLSFMLYIWMLIQTVSGGGWIASEVVRLVLLAFVPFGGFTNERLFQRKLSILDQSSEPSI